MTIARSLTRVLSLSILAVCTLGLPSCSSYGPTLEAAKAFGVKNARMPETDLLCAGQLTEAQFRDLVAVGYKTFICLRASSEKGTGWEETLAKGYDVGFERIPIRGKAGLSQRNTMLVSAALTGARRPAVLYCGSSNRVGAMLALKEFWLHSASPERALAYGKKGGMTRLEPAVREIMKTEKR